MNVCLNGNLTQMLVIQVDDLVTRKIKSTLPLASTLFCFLSNITVCIFYSQGVNNITPSLRQGVSLLK